MTKLRIKKVLSCILVVVLVIGNCLTALAANPRYSSKEDVFTIYDDGETVVRGYEDGDGNMVFTQYVGGDLVQRNTISYDNSEVIRREFFGNLTARGTSRDTINIHEYGVLNKSHSDFQLISPRTLAGTINYRAIIDTGYVYYGLRCNYDTKVFPSSTYTINSYVGSVVDLVSIIAGAFSISVAIISPYITELLRGLGILVVGGVIKSAFSDTVGCTETDYTWTLTDTTDSHHSKNVTGAKYYITDSRSGAKDKYYYEGYTPNDWGTQAMAVWFHNEMFGYTTWEVVNWS